MYSKVSYDPYGCSHLDKGTKTVEILVESTEFAIYYYNEMTVNIYIYI